jgi:hypothetical protein
MRSALHVAFEPQAQVLEYPRRGAGGVHWPLTAHRHTQQQVDAKRSGDLGLLALPRAPGRTGLADNTVLFAF